MKLHLTYEFESEDELRSHLGGVSTATPEVVETPAPAATPATTSDEPTRESTDVDGMPYDESIHSDPPNFTADGKWRAKRGKADEAKAAREQFLARGGNVTPPTELPSTPPAAAPGAPAAPAASAAPTLPESAPEPVSIESLYDRISALLQGGALDKDSLGALYQKHAGAADPETVHAVLTTNETKRSQMLADLASYGDTE